MNVHSGMIHQSSSVSFLLYTAGLFLLFALIGYWYASKWKKDNTSKLKKEQKAALKKKTNNMRLTSHILLTVSILLAVGYFAQDMFKSYNVEKLNFKAAIQVKSDPYYGAGHTDDPVPYEMKIPTSGSHSPHDLKFGFYKEKPKNEMLVHNLEHGDIIIYYRANTDPAILEQLDYLTKFRKAGAGILAVPNEDIPASKQFVVTAWTKTMELDQYDEAQIGTFIYDYINKGPEQIPASIRRGGGTM